MTTAPIDSDAARQEFGVLYVLFVQLGARDDDAAVLPRASVARRLVELAPMVGLTPAKLHELRVACKLVEDMAAPLQKVDSLEARLAKLRPYIDSYDKLDNKTQRAVDAEFRRLEHELARVQRRSSKCLQTFVRARAGCSRQRVRATRGYLHRSTRRSCPRRRSSHASGARGSGASEGDGDGPPEPPPHPAKVLGTDNPRRQPSSDGYHRPRTFAGRNLATTCVLVDAGRELP